MTVVYIAATHGRWSAKSPSLQNIPRNWQSEERVKPEEHAKAMAALRQHYITKAKSCGMTLQSYCQRFGVKL